MSRSDHDMATGSTQSGDGLSGLAVFDTEVSLPQEIEDRIVHPQFQKPIFSSEGQEADWYAAHPEYSEALFDQAEAEGKLGESTAAKRLGLTTSTTIRLSQDDLEKARIQAARKGLRYQTYMKMLLHEALLRAEQQP